MKRIAYVCLLAAFTIEGAIAQIPNNGMEHWTEAPTLIDWTTNSYPLTLPPWEPYIVRQDADAHTGQSCANFWGNGMFKPFATTTFALGSAHPTQFEFWYKLNFPPCVNEPGSEELDTVSVDVEILFQGIVVDQGHWESTVSVMDYTPVSIPISQEAFQFDSCSITIRGGKVFGGCGIVIAPTEFRIDDLNLILPQEGCVDPEQIDLNMGCPEIFDPVCGCDNVTYSNTCEAYYYGGVTNWTQGACSGCVAEFEYSNTTTDFAFLDQSSVVQPSHMWNFGDGTTSEQANPEHQFAMPGWYQVCLIVSGLNDQGQECSDIACHMVYANDGCIDSSLICQPGSLCCDAPLFEPVCGCDGNEYMNACVATLWGGVMTMTPGPCDPNAVNNLATTELHLIPNPSNGRVLLDLANSNGPFLLNVTDAIGRHLSTTVFTDNQHMIDLSAYDEGIYHLRVVSQNNHILQGKVVVAGR
jgi:hypothetical protein